MLRIVENLIGESSLHDPSMTHDRDAVGEQPGNGEVVSDDDHRQPAFGDKAAEKIQQPRLNGDWPAP